MSIPVSNSWKLTFDDEFNGTSLNRNLWGNNWLGNAGAITKPINSSELAAYDPALATVSGGMLHLNAVAAPVAVGGHSYDYRSGIVQTSDSFSQTYGYFEARINLAGSGGKISDWPAFWLDGASWPTDGEIDIMEGLEGEASYHTHSPSGGPGDSVAGDFTGWHVFGALWQPGKVSFYYDNQLVGELTGYDRSSPNYLILNLGIGDHSILSVPAEMQVDWVHVYTLDGSGKAVAQQTGYTGAGGTGALVAAVPAPAPTPTPAPAPSPQPPKGTAGNDTLTGTAAIDLLNGGAGNDVITAKAANDILIGGSGRDVLTGGSGHDRFDFNSIAEAGRGPSRDIIRDFVHLVDHIDLRTVDAAAFVAGNQAFRFVGTHAFHGVAGELRYWHANAVGSAADKTVVEGDVTGDGKADFQIELSGLKLLTAADFIL